MKLSISRATEWLRAQENPDALWNRAADAVSSILAEESEGLTAVDVLNATRTPVVPEVIIYRGESGQKVARRRLYAGHHVRPDEEMISLQDMVDHLIPYALYRERDYDLLLTLRNRGIRYAKEQNLSDSDIAKYLPGSVMEAFLIRVPELTALHHLASGQSSDLIDLSQQLGHQVARSRKTIMGWLRGENTLHDVTAGYYTRFFGATAYPHRR